MLESVSHSIQPSDIESHNSLRSNIVIIAVTVVFLALQQHKNI